MLSIMFPFRLNKVRFLLSLEGLDAGKQLWRVILGLLEPDQGTVEISGRSIHSFKRLELAKLVQPIFQDPYSSLNPRKTIGSIIDLPMRVQGEQESETYKKRTLQVMDLVGLPPRMYQQYPNQLSGGQPACCNSSGSC